MTIDVCTNGGAIGASCSNEGNEWITIPAGDFIQGCSSAEQTRCNGLTLDEVPTHTVTLSEYQIQKFQVTNGQYKQCAAAGACEPLYTTTPDMYNFPVVQIDWYQATTYCSWIGGELPTDAQWEKAARGPSPSENIFPWGDSAPDCTIMNFSDDSNGDGCDAQGMVQAGIYPLNVSYYGVRDMAGNVMEWVKDCWAEDYYQTAPTTDPQGPQPGVGACSHSIRGGAWNYSELQSHISFRSYIGDPNYNGYVNLGFRCAKN